MHVFVRSSISLLIGWACLCLSGCHEPLKVEETAAQSPALAKIQQAFERTVHNALNDPEVEWRAGWIGNMQINWDDSRSFGLCHHWQDIVYAGVIDTVKQVGWEATGVRINNDTYNEHHAVLVYDPDVVQRDQILDRMPWYGAYVLDAWKRGEPDIYHLPEWIDAQLFKRRPPELESLPYTPKDGSNQPWLRGY